MRSNRRLLSSNILLIALAALVAGCGGGDGEKNTASAPQTSPPPASANAPPSIQGEPGSSVLAGQSYSFQPNASDPNGDTLTFSASNLPSWATLNATTGRLTGTPTAAEVAIYSGITITVSDGTSTAALSPFNIEVTGVGAGSATLSWSPPTVNTDGTALTNLAGYRVLYGRSATELEQTIAITNPSVSTYVVDNLSVGTWYFAVTAVNAGGVVSTPSNVASKTIS